MSIDPQPPQPPAAPRATGREPVRQIDSATLLGPRGEVHIAHAQQLYRLRITAQGKLILTK
jgi:hemin uptake protein HemP